MFKAKKTQDAVSPVIGVILLVAVTVALVALATVIVFDIGSDVSDTADATVQLDQVDDGIQATVIRNENVDSFVLSGPNDADAEDAEFDHPEDVTMSEVGDSVMYVAESDNLDGEEEPVTLLENGDSVSVIATLEDGSEEVLTSTQYNA